jgi:hypothetical protein
MRILFISILLVASGLFASAQSATDTCSFLKNLTFNNGRDTIIVKAVLLDYLQAPPRLITKKPPRIYRYKFTSDVSFQPENCAKKYKKPVLSNVSDKEGIFEGDNLGTTIYLTCLVFNESFLNKNEPDCLVIGISKKKPSMLK